jgi:hypothetical protein
MISQLAQKAAVKGSSLEISVPSPALGSYLRSSRKMIRAYGLRGQDLPRGVQTRNAAG